MVQPLGDSNSFDGYKSKREVDAAHELRQQRCGGNVYRRLQHYHHMLRYDRTLELDVVSVVIRVYAIAMVD